MIGERIQQARKASGLSLRALAEKVGVSAMAISKYENNQSTPSSGVMLALAKALQVRTEYFFRQIEVELREVEYRKHSKLPKKVLTQIEGDVLEQVERYLVLEDILPVSPVRRFVLPEGLPDKINDFDEIEHIANVVREEWKLGQNPILDLTGTLEERGIKVFQTHALHDGKFDGLACRVNGAPIIVVGADWPGDRQRFTMAHELGHLILEGRLDEAMKEQEEKLAHRFAGAFLAPAAEVYNELGRRRSWFEPRELCVLKKAYGLSMGGWLHRAKDLSIMGDSVYIEMVKMFRRYGWHKQEPCDEYPREEPQVFTQLVFHALAEELISESKAAELMGKSLVEFRVLRKVDHASAATH
ncbi:XRE family transcriptional regulator [Sulfuriflexus sp.]|uniref:helix-turn-helix domain-containing protein n=1 Tax=Sulfuriflexus sp. TaxID=2015443 RepID=UPI0028CCC7B8|nr:XRE family transcriptional regulator [Sulfuriflexus sp.]MDT8405048.1 XRE family transcriptional regulator [Sulfuriflexus sp.]